MTRKSSIALSRSSLNGNDSADSSEWSVYSAAARGSPRYGKPPTTADAQRRTCSEKVWHRAAARISFEISRPLLTLAKVGFHELHPFVGN